MQQAACAAENMYRCCAAVVVWVGPGVRTDASTNETLGAVLLIVPRHTLLPSSFPPCTALCVQESHGYQSSRPAYLLGVLQSQQLHQCFTCIHLPLS